MIMKDEILENQIKLLEQMLKEYMRIAKLSGQDPFKSQTVNNMLDKLSELYKQRKK